MEIKFCQSCGMPMQEEGLYGTNAEDSRNEEYCCYCYQKGKFTADCTMEEMIEHCLQYLDDFNKEMGTQKTMEQARSEMQQFFPTLKRWQKS